MTGVAVLPSSPGPSCSWLPSSLVGTWARRGLRGRGLLRGGLLGGRRLLGRRLLRRRPSSRGLLRRSLLRGRPSSPGAFFARAAFFAGGLGGRLRRRAFFAGRLLRAARPSSPAAFLAGGAFFAGAFFAAAPPSSPGPSCGRRAFFTGAVVFAAVFLVAPAVPLVAAAGGRRATTLRAAEAALPASDRVVLRAMGNLPGTRARTREGRGRRSGVQAPSMGEGISAGGLTQSRHACRDAAGLRRARRGLTPPGEDNDERPAPAWGAGRPERGGAGQASSSPSTDRSRFGWAMPASWEPGVVGSAEPELSRASSCWLK